MIRSEKTLIVIPAYEAWRPREGDQVAIFGLRGDPNDPTTSWECAWGIRRKARLSPLFLHGFIDVVPLTGSEREKLQDVLGVEITELAKEQLEIAIQQLTTHVALKSKLPTLKRLDAHLRKAIQATNILIDLFDSRSQPILNGVPSIDQTIASHVVLALPDFPQERQILEITNRIQTLRDVLRQVLRDTKPRRGPKADIAFHVFCMALIDIGHTIKADLTLPTRKTSKNVNFVNFVRQVISLVSENGTAAIDKAPLSKEEKRIAQNKLRSYVDKSRRTLCDALRAAKAATKHQAGTINSAAPNAK
jgi:hypothetical protein